MLGRTHFFIGTAAALAVLQPQTVPALVAGAGAAAIGGLISDIDVGTSQAHRDADKIITATVAVAVLTILAEYKLNLGIYRRLTSDSSVLRLLTGTAAFLLICAYGKQQPHRSFMHSFAALALLTALVVSFLMTPVVKSFAYKVGAIDVPKDERRMHHKPIPRLGGLAIFTGFMASILLFVDIRLNPQMQSILLGAVIIVVLGVVDDIMALPAKLKFVIQIVAALIPALNGVSIQALSNPNIFSPNAYWVLNWLSVPITVLWIVGITNAVNLIDGLDGLANGVSAISAATVLVIALICSEAQVAVVMAALVGACVGFLPYNLNPAKMFMGDTGATFLGFILSTMSIQGLFKFYAVISFAVPFLILGLPIFDTAFAMIRRMAHGQSPMHADRGHIHHRLIDMGLNQKQAVATLYVISGILGLSAVVLTTGGEAKAMLLLIALCVVAVVAARVVFPKEVKEELHEELEELTELGHHEEKDKQKEDGSHE